MDKVYCTDLRTRGERPICRVCKAAFSAKTGNKASHGREYFGKDCRGCRNERVHLRRRIDCDTFLGRRSARWRRNKYKRPYLVHRKSYCETCGFIPLDMVQLDVDHIDGNHTNNELSNLKTLCANCHRLKTQLDWVKKYDKR